jgi:hypothetical protein
MKRGNAVCPGCGRPGVTNCPYCDRLTFAGNENCDSCGMPLLISCENKRCQEPQFFENQRCTACGKPVKKAAKQIEALRKRGR